MTWALIITYAASVAVVPGYKTLDACEKAATTYTSSNKWGPSRTAKCIAVN